MTDSNQGLDYVGLFNIVLTLISLFVSWGLTMYNYQFLKKKNRKDKMYQAYIDYYLPIQIKLLDFIVCFKYHQITVDILNEIIIKNQNTTNEMNILKDYYKCCEEFIEFYGNLHIIQMFENLDEKILKIVLHINFVMKTKDYKMNTSYNLEYGDILEVPIYQELFDAIKDTISNEKLF